MANCCCNPSQFANCGSVFGCANAWRPVYGPTGPTGPAAPEIERAYAQMAQAQAVANGDLLTKIP